jgi:SNF2 family DNA or RNA helicase
VLLVVPAGLKASWHAMFKKHSKGLNVFEYTSNCEKQFKVAISNRYCVTLLLYDKLTLIVKKHLNNDSSERLLSTKWGLLVMDEAHYCRNPTRRFQACTEVTRTFTLCCTGKFPTSIFLPYT